MKSVPSLLVLALLSGCHANTQHVDILIRHGLVYDGTGTKPVAADIGLVGDKIVFVGTDSDGVSADTIVEANGLAIAPGFIDAHSHVPEAAVDLDGPMLDIQDLSQGVTTIMASPDGELSPDQMAQLRDMLLSRGIAVNFGCYVGHNGLRDQVMPGLRRAATPKEIDAMAAKVKQGMDMGCVGLSTGLMYDPGMYATAEEVRALAAVVKPFGGSYDSHTRDPGFHMVASEKEAIDVGVHVGIPAKLAHLKATGLINKGHIGDVIAMVESARAEGHDIVADQYPFDGATVRSIHDLFVLPDGRGDKKISRAEVLSALADPNQRSLVMRATEQGVNGGFSWIKAVGYGNIRIVEAPDNPELVDANIELLAKKRGVSPFDLIASLTDLNGVRVTLGTIDEGDIRALIVKPWVMIASDGAYIDPKSVARGFAHPRGGGSFTRVLGYYARELKLFPMEEAIRKMTSFPAQHLGLTDRGRIAKGLAADLVIFDPTTVNAKATYANPAALSVGVHRVYVNGQLAYQDGKATGETAGRFVKRQALR